MHGDLLHPKKIQLLAKTPPNSCGTEQEKTGSLPRSILNLFQNISVQDHTCIHWSIIYVECCLPVSCLIACFETSHVTRVHLGDTSPTQM